MPPEADHRLGIAVYVAEDEWGLSNAVIYKGIQERYRELVFASGLLIIEGRIDNERGGVLHILAERLEACPMPPGKTLVPASHNFA